MHYRFEMNLIFEADSPEQAGRYLRAFLQFGVSPKIDPSIRTWRNITKHPLNPATGEVTDPDGGGENPILGRLKLASTVVPNDFMSRAAARVADLDLPGWVLVDESGQTSEVEHARWLATAPEVDIRQWVADVERQA